MAEQHPPEFDEKEAEDRFNKTFERLVNTPHKPDKPVAETQNKTGAKSKKRG